MKIGLLNFDTGHWTGRAWVEVLNIETDAFNRSLFMIEWGDARPVFLELFWFQLWDD